MLHEIREPEVEYVAASVCEYLRASMSVCVLKSDWERRISTEISGSRG